MVNGDEAHSGNMTKCRAFCEQRTTLLHAGPSSFVNPKDIQNSLQLVRRRTLATQTVMKA
ncbi:hypothetical protein GN244_ATG11352 [Phytophthora infestans]|uniref:Uncharacterized protein n=1 Tax=Phytophthora infestans TaxID=4787 RepID=A0A833RZZ7_PHYIN|nr:hypothetical protein GN244_ATG11352 [Phytophthora infestans]KAF4140962.1 hypothetical protein GN958_ATG09810 [Phytophthora infestans]